MSAVLESLSKRLCFTAHIFTSAPESIFTQSLTHYRYHEYLTDIGFAQKDALEVDLEATCTQLHTLIPFDDNTLSLLAEKCQNMSLIICDISPMGIAVAKKLGIPSVLIENFTWDWLYDAYSKDFPLIGFFARYLEEQFASVDYHIQTEPVCNPTQADLRCGPIFRRIRENPTRIRGTFQCGQRKIVLVTMGGITFFPAFLNLLKEYSDFFFIFCGQQKNGFLSENVQLLDKSSNYFHPDLINCADITVFKSGYSTLAECYQTGKATLCIQRDGFAESTIIEAFAQKNLLSTVVSQTDFTSGKWLELLPETVSYQPQQLARENGADAVADFLFSLL